MMLRMHAPRAGALRGRRAVTYAALAIFLQVTQSTFGQKPSLASTQLTLSDAINLAFQHNPSRQIAVHTELSARQNYLSESSPINPTLQYAGLNSSVGVLNGFGTAGNYAFYLTLETSGRWHYRSDQAKWEYVAAKEGTQGARIALLQSVTAAYVALQVAQADLENEQLAWNDTNKLADLALQQFKLGAAPETNSIRASLALKQEDQNLIKARSTLELARQTLDNQMGVDPGVPVTATDALTYDVSALNADSLQKLALENRYEIKQGLATEKSLRATVGLNRSSFFPDVLLGTAFEGTGLEIGLTIPVDLGSIRSSVNKAREDVLVQRATNEKQRQQVLLDVRSAYENLQQAQKIVNSFRSDELPQAEALFDKVRKGFSLGASTILDVIDAQATLRTARSGLNDAIGSYNTALSQLLVAVGLPLDRIKRDASASPSLTTPPSPKQ